MNMTFKKFGYAVPLLAVSAVAHAQSSVTLYGLIDQSIQYGHVGGVNTYRMDSSSIQPSNWGLQGTEDIGGGQKVIFRLESGFSASTGAMAQTGKMFGREAWVGMAGPWGRFQVGLNNTPMQMGLIRFEAGDLGHWDWGHAGNNYDFFASTKVSNSIIYTSPTFMGLTASAMYARGTNGATGQPATLGDTVTVGLNYTNGPFAAEADYLQQTYTATPLALTTNSPTHIGNHSFFGASYDLGFMKVDGMFVLHRGSSQVATINANNFAAPNNYYYDVSAQIRNVVGGTIVLDFGQYHQQNSNDFNSTSYGIRYDYRLSKRTGVYAGVAGIKNNRLATFAENDAQGPGITVAPGAHVLAAIMGMMHTF